MAVIIDSDRGRGNRGFQGSMGAGSASLGASQDNVEGRRLAGGKI